MTSLFNKLFKPNTPAVDAIYISEATLADSASYYDGMMSLVDYTNAVMHDALYLTSEFPKEAYWLYLADYYISQVNNGGHSGFLHNARETPGQDAAIAMAARGMNLIGCSVLAEVLAKLESWRQENGQAAQPQGGLRQNTAELDLLDKAYFAIERDTFYQAANAWMRSSPVVSILSADALAKAVGALREANPRYEVRRRVNTIAALDAGLVKDTVAPFRSCVAGVLSHEMPFEVKAIESGQPKEDHILWSLDTSSGRMFGVIGDDAVEMFAKNPEDGLLHRIFDRPMVHVEAQLERAAYVKPARYAYELGQKLFPDDPILWLGFYAGETVKNKDIYFITTKSDAQYFLILDPNAAAMVDPKTNSVLANITGKEFKNLSKEDHTKLV